VTELVVYAVVVAAVLAAGIAIGMLVAPRLERLVESDEEARDRDDPADD
jgi:hypothetical protein